MQERFRLKSQNPAIENGVVFLHTLCDRVHLKSSPTQLCLPNYLVVAWKYERKWKG